MKLKIVVDFDLCEGNANCMKLAPALFQVDDKDMLTVLQETVSDDQKAAAQKAARACPKRAITLVETE